MNQADLIHEWKFPPSSKLIRWYLWLYGAADKTKITFCKLFWGTLLTPFALILYLFANGVGFVFTHWPTSPPKSEEEKTKRAEAEVLRKAQKALKPSAAMRFIQSVAAFFDLLAMFFQAHRWIGRSLKVILGVLLLLIAPLVGLSALGVTVYTFRHGFYTGLIWTGWIVGGIIVGALLVTFLAWLITKSRPGIWLMNWLDAHLWEERLVPMGHGFKRSGRGFGRFMAGGYYSVKYRTCPRVIIEEP